MRTEQVMFPIVRAIKQRPKVAEFLLGRTAWGNPFAEERFRFPYPIYDRMRADGEVVYSKTYKQWFVFGYDEVHEVLRSPNATNSATRDLMLSISPYTKLSPIARSSLSQWLLVNDGVIHTRLRTAVSRAFTPRRVETWGPLVRTATDELIHDLRANGLSNVDVVRGFTERLPIHVIGELLGIPKDRREWFRQTSRVISSVVDPLTGFDPVEMSRAFEELHAWFAVLVEQRRANPTDDLISDLVRSDDDQTLSTDEVLSMLGLLLLAGHETLTGLLGNSIVALARFPEQRTLLRTKPEIIDNAIEELIRYDSSVQTTGRSITGPVVAGGTTIPTGATVGLFIGAANHDARRFDDPDALRLEREDPRPISFGFGLHYCLGASLARLEMRVAIPALLDAFGDYTIDATQTTWKQSLTLKTPTRLVMSAS